MVEFFTSPLGLVILGIILALIAESSRRWNLKPKYTALIIAGLFGITGTIFKFAVPEDLQNIIIMWASSIFGFATAFYNIVIKTIKDA